MSSSPQISAKCNKQRGDDHLAIIQDYKSGLSLTKCAIKYKCSVGKIEYVTIKYGAIRKTIAKRVNGRFPIKCVVCSAEKMVIHSHRKQRFCSKRCEGRWRAHLIKGEGHPNWSGGEVTIRCEICNQEFKDRPQRKRRFCSMGCHGAWMSQNGRGEGHPNWKGGEVVSKCETCDKDIKDRVSQERRFCSMGCKGQWQSKSIRGENHPNWLGGLSLESYAVEWTERLREYIRAKDSYQCQLCDRQQSDFSRALSVHHIDYNKHNNDEHNLMSLCVKCHTGTNYNRSYWHGLFVRKTIEKQKVNTAKPSASTYYWENYV